MSRTISMTSSCSNRMECRPCQISSLSPFSTCSECLPHMPALDRQTDLPHCNTWGGVLARGARGAGANKEHYTWPAGHRLHHFLHPSRFAQKEKSRTSGGCCCHCCCRQYHCRRLSHQPQSCDVNNVNRNWIYTSHGTRETCTLPGIAPGPKVHDAYERVTRS